MAKITPAPADPDAVPHGMRDLQIRVSQKWGIIAQKRPTKGPPETPLMRAYRKRFGIAARMASNAHWLDALTAMEMAKGTQQVPRDILTMAALGRYYDIVNPDGTVWGHVEGPIWTEPEPPGPGPGPDPSDTRELVMQWSQWGDAYYSFNDSAAAAWKGAIIKPVRSFDVTAIGAVLQVYAAGTYRAAIAELDGSNVITALALSDPLSPSTNVRTVLYWDLEATLTAGTTVAVMVGRTDQGASHALPINRSFDAKWLWPTLTGGGFSLAETEPAIGQTVPVILSLKCPPLGLRLLDPA